MTFHRIGLLILLVHDASDVPVDLMRAFNTLGAEITTAVCWVVCISVFATVGSQFA